MSFNYFSSQVTFVKSGI